MSLPLIFSALILYSIALTDERVADPVTLSGIPVAETFGSAVFTEVQLRNFETTVRPVLAEHCLRCHGPEKQWSGLRLDSRTAILRGGDSGPAAIAGDPENSLLIRAIRHEDDNLKMPEDGKLSDREIDLLSAWIRDGLPFPDIPPAEKHFRNPDHWAFQPISPVAVPDVINGEWPRSDLDRFILHRLEEAGIEPAPPADRRTLIRRVTFDLTGLPPTPEEVNDFVTDTSESAYERVVDRLLADPGYGEHWGRHWLDVARYADSNGLDENVAHGNAWRYRDYVVRSFNADKPFDQFILEQLAGDLLTAESDEQKNDYLTATGFLAIGPKVLAEVNMPKMRLDIIDEQIDTTGRVFLGMTFGCARCHDHKFDPIDTTDYYGLAGIFKSTRTMETYTKVARWHEYPLKTAEGERLQSEYDARLASLKSRVEDLTSAISQQSDGPDDSGMELQRLQAEIASLESSPPELPAVMGVTEDEIVEAPVQIRGNPSRSGEIVPRCVPKIMAGTSPPVFRSEQSGRRELAEWLIHPEHPLTSRVLINRFWRWHFGRGIVPSPDNFGLLGELPTHPELLDWMAREFVRSGWSLKSVHRMIVLSSVYRQSSVTTPDAVTKDPDNRLRGRFPVRRLRAEELRDSLLSVSGKLDRTMGGSLLKVKNRGYFFDHTSIDTTDYRSDRRSLYLPVVRNNVFDQFQLMDFPDPAVPSGDRATTTVAPQALMLLNSEFIMDVSVSVARRLLTGDGAADKSDDEKLQMLYQLCFGRLPADDELAADRRMLDEIRRSLPHESDASETRASETAASETDRESAIWSVLCHTLLASNEFCYVQ